MSVWEDVGRHQRGNVRRWLQPHPTPPPLNRSCERNQGKNQEKGVADTFEYLCPRAFLMSPRMLFHLQQRAGQEVEDVLKWKHAPSRCLCVCVWRHLGCVASSAFKHRTHTLGSRYFTICSIYARDSCLPPWSNGAPVISSVPCRGVEAMGFDLRLQSIPPCWVNLLFRLSRRLL